MKPTEHRTERFFFFKLSKLSATVKVNSENKGYINYKEILHYNNNNFIDQKTFT